MAVLEPLKQAICTSAYEISYERYLLIDSIIRDDPSFHMNFDRYNMSHSERKDKAVDVYIAVEALTTRLSLTRHEKRFVYSRINQYSDSAVHLDVYYNAFRLLASPAQIDQWLSLIEKNQLQLAFCVTELGHGTELNRLETTAFYDPLQDEIVINSPTLESMKWWSGSNEYTTHMILYANLIVNSRSEGIFPFFFQIRNLETLELLPEVTQGDIGPRAGLELQGYHYYKFSNLRVPSSALMQRFVRFENGRLNLLHPQAKSLVMSSIEYMRVMLISWAWRPTSLALTIAVRYSEVRRQFNTLPGTTKERKVMDYQLQQLKLIPALASVFGQLFGGRELMKQVDEHTEATQRGNFERGAEINCLSTCCKAHYTWTTLTDLEVCRRACGGHGYSQFSGIPQLFLNYMPAVTFEGDNTVMALQSAKTLVGARLRLSSGKGVPKAFGFLADKSPLLGDPLHDRFGTLLFSQLTDALTKNLITKTKALEEAGINPRTIRTSFTQQDEILLGKAYCYYFTHMSFAAATAKVYDPTTNRLLTLLRQVYFVMRVIEFGSVILREQLISAAVFSAIKASLPQLFKELRPNLLTIVNSFDYSDTFLCSALGRKDGQVYEALLELAKSNPVNKAQPNPSILKHVKPLARL